MYSILIVDDEDLICKGLKSMIERNCQKNIDSIHHTVKPLCVMGLIEEFNPDIIITDIRMPDMSGLELIKLVSGAYPHIKFIALSGYDDFNYVKEAFKLGVVDYLLKPASMEELNTVLGKVICAIEDERKRDLDQKSDDMKLKQAVIENKLNKLFAGISIEEENLHSFYNEAYDYFTFPEFSISIISKGNCINKNGNGEWIVRSIEKHNEFFSHIEGINVFKLFSLSNDLILLINMDSKSRYKIVMEHLKKLIEGLEESLELEFFVASSNSETGIENILKCYKQAREALEYRIVFRTRKIILYKDIGPFNGEIAYEKQLAKIKENILSLNKIEISSTIDELFDLANLKNCSIGSIRKMYAGVTLILQETAARNGMPLMSELILDFSRFNYLSDVRIHLKTIIFDMISKLKECRKNKSVVDIVKEFVHENIHRDIDLARAANMVSVSYSHFSKLFKDETGMNFTDYLTKARMEKALEMLSDPINRIQDISVNVGYGNPKHFTRAFKNYFGFSPSEYRSN